MFYRITYNIVYCSVYLVCTVYYDYCTFSLLYDSVLCTYRLNTYHWPSAVCCGQYRDRVMWWAVLVAWDIPVCSASSFPVDNLFTLIHVLYSCIQYVRMVNIYICIYIYTCRYKSMTGFSVSLPTHYINLKVTVDLSMFMGVNFCWFC